MTRDKAGFISTFSTVVYVHVQGMEQRVRISVLAEEKGISRRKSVSVVKNAGESWKKYCMKTSRFYYQIAQNSDRG